MGLATCSANLISLVQVNENAKQDLKEGLLLYNTENNVGLKNAWNIIQAEVSCWPLRVLAGGWWAKVTSPRGICWREAG